MKALRRAGWVSVLAAAWVMLAGTTAPGQVLEQVPDNAQVVYKFKNMQGFSDKFAGLAKRLGWAEVKSVDGASLRLFSRRMVGHDARAGHERGG